MNLVQLVSMTVYRPPTAAYQPNQKTLSTVKLCTSLFFAQPKSLMAYSA